MEINRIWKKDRQVNIEVLRIVAMLMIISLHYLGKGEALIPFSGNEFPMNGYIAWLIEAFAYVAVNIYILISGYFLVDSKFRIDKLIRIWLQVLFYSIGIWLLFKVTGLLPEEFNTTYYSLTFLAPVGMQHNWFASFYIMLYCLSPFLAILVKKVSKKQLQACIVILLFLFTKVYSLLFPWAKPIDDNGYGIIWMICLFIIAGYIKLYVPITGAWRKKIGWYALCSILTFASYLVINTFYFTTGKLGDFTKILFNYNSPTTAFASIALFLAFLNMGQKKTKVATKQFEQQISKEPQTSLEQKTSLEQVDEKPFFKKAVLFIASLTFGIYLIHDHILLRGLWKTLWKVPEAFERKYFILHFAGVVLVVFIACGIIEAIRQWIFGFLYRSKFYGSILKKMKKIDMRMNGEGNEIDE